MYVTKIYQWLVKKVLKLLKLTFYLQIKRSSAFNKALQELQLHQNLLKNPEDCPKILAKSKKFHERSEFKEPRTESLKRKHFGSKETNSKAKRKSDLKRSIAEKQAPIILENMSVGRTSNNSMSATLDFTRFVGSSSTNSSRNNSSNNNNRSHNNKAGNVINTASM